MCVRFLHRHAWRLLEAQHALLDAAVYIAHQEQSIVHTNKLLHLEVL